MKKQSSYYGGFFWIALLSFAVPVFVAWKAFDKVQPTTKPVPVPDVSGVDHNIFDYLLKTYVENGLVDYEGISRDYLFTTYLGEIGQAKPELLETDDEKLALHINAYNALVINGVITHKIHRKEKNVLAYQPPAAAKKIAELEKDLQAEKQQRSPDGSRIEQLQAEIKQGKDESGFFKLKEHIFAGKTISLDELEQEIIRPTFNEPRIHVALVCAAISCPAIRAEAYVGPRLQQQLEDQAIQFANNTNYVSYDAGTDQVKLSPILKWYAEDFDEAGGYRPWVAQRVENESWKAKLLGDTAIGFNVYDWTLNSQTGGSGGHGGATSGFGSGSVPNE